MSGVFAPTRQAPSSPNWWALSILLSGTVITVIFVWLITIVPHPMPSPNGYQTYTAQDKAFRCDAPSGWTAVYYSDPTPAIGGVAAGGMMFSKNDAIIDIHSDSTDKLDLEGNLKLLGQAFMTNQPPSLVDSAVDTENSRLDQLPVYSNRSIDTVVTQANVSLLSNGPGTDFPALTWDDPQVREFTGLRRGYPFLQKVHGYCIAMVGSTHFVIMLCYCAELNWTALKPAFQHVAESMLEGEQEVTYSSDGDNSFSSSTVEFKAPQQVENEIGQPEAPAQQPVTDYSKPNWDTGTPQTGPGPAVPAIQSPYGANATLPVQPPNPPITTGSHLMPAPQPQPAQGAWTPNNSAGAPQAQPPAAPPPGVQPASQPSMSTSQTGIQPNMQPVPPGSVPQVPAPASAQSNQPVTAPQNQPAAGSANTPEAPGSAP